MNCEIITIGDEILIGQVVDTNSAFIASELNAIGIKITQILSISDDEEEIFYTVTSALKNSQIVILTGGLGPTNDDITKKTLVNYFNTSLIRNKEILEYITQLLEQRGIAMSALNEYQADLPEICIPLHNKVGTAPGMLFRIGTDKVLFSLPGVPFEMKALMIEEVIPWLKSNFELPVRIQKTFLTTGIPESTMALRLKKFENELPENFSLAYLPSPGLLRLRLSTEGNERVELAKFFETQSEKLQALLANDLFGYDEDTLESTVGKLLKDNNFTVCSAESCSGGTIAQLITSVPGASEYFKGGVIAYSNEIKEQFLKISSVSLKDFGAVSKQVVVQMAENARQLFKSDFGIATSGIAGPTGGTDDKPVGTVWIAVASPRTTQAMKFQFGEHRGRTITRSSLTALNILRLEIQKIVKKTIEKV
jgi:nicotinamide-nucleotide amidase